MVDRCLAALPADRFQNVGELARALAPWGPPGSEELAARILRVSAPPPSPEVEKATVPLRAVVEPTLDDPEAGRSAPPTPPSVPAPEATPPRPSLVKWLAIGAVVLVIALAVLLTSGALGAISGIFARTEVLKAPLPAIDPRAFDVVDVLPAAKALAHRLEPRAQLAGIEIIGGARAGLASVETNQIDFEFDYGGDEGEGFVVVRVMPSELLASRTPIPGARKPLPDPKCNARHAVQAAVGSGVPKDAAPDLRYGAREGVATWRLEVPHRPELSRAIDALSCAIVPIPR